MFEKIKYLYLSILEQENFPGWELYIFFNTCFWVFVLLHLYKCHRDNSEIKQRVTAFSVQIINAIRESQKD